MTKLLPVLCLLLCLVVLAGCAASAAQEVPTVTTHTPQSAAAGKALPSAESAPADIPALISREEAISIALAHAGISPDQARFLECEYEPDDGIREYDVEFHAGTYEYSYEIHAQTGQILHCEKEPED